MRGVNSTTHFRELRTLPTTTGLPSMGVIEIKIMAEKTDDQRTQNGLKRRRIGAASNDPAAAAAEENDIKNPINVAGIPTYFSSHTT